MITNLLLVPAEKRKAKSRGRLRLIFLCFTALYGAIAFKMVKFAVNPHETAAKAPNNELITLSRPDLFDRNGKMLATDLRRASLYAEPHRLLDSDEAAEHIHAVIPDLKLKDLEKKLDSDKQGFIWVKRQITQSQQDALNKKFTPGLGFMYENRRIYPNGVLASHILGHVDIDNRGVAGIEKTLDKRSMVTQKSLISLGDTKPEPVTLSIDLTAQHIMREELVKAMAYYKAKAAAGVVMDVRTGEIISMVSLPDFDSNAPGTSMDETRLNRMTTGVFEMGSTFKAITTAMALDSGKVSLNSTFDTRHPLVYGGRPINDYHGQKRVLTVPEVFIYSSNIGTAKMALAVGVTKHKEFLKKLGQLDRLQTEVVENAMPLYPKNWQEVHTVTAAFGHGIAVAPLQATAAVAALVNGGYYIAPTFIKRSEEEANMIGRRVIKDETSKQMRYLMRLNAERGSGKQAEVDGYYVGGKTGTSEKVVAGRYSKTKLLTSFMGIFPADNPRYVILTMLDEPQGLKETKGYATSGWNAAPVTAKLISRLAPALGIEPRGAMAAANVVIPVSFKGNIR
jgi:cell division protein FtsI (penicillin-binding protein 3)